MKYCSPTPCRAQHCSCLRQAVARRAALGLLAGAAALIANAQPSEAAFGEAARVFGGKPTNTSGEPRTAADCSLAGARPTARVLRGGWRARLHPVLGRGLCAAAARALEPQQGEGLPRHAAAVRPAVSVAVRAAVRAASLHRGSTRLYAICMLRQQALRTRLRCCVTYPRQSQARPGAVRAEDAGLLGLALRRLTMRQPPRRIATRSSGAAASSCRAWAAPQCPAQSRLCRRECRHGSGERGARARAGMRTTATP